MQIYFRESVLVFGGEWITGSEPCLMASFGVSQGFSTRCPPMCFARPASLLESENVAASEEKG
jgi:hypothetical protein